MIKLVLTMLIMLPVVLLSPTRGGITIASSYASQNFVTAPTKSTKLPILPIQIPRSCTTYDTDNPFVSLIILQKQPIDVLAVENTSQQSDEPEGIVESIVEEMPKTPVIDTPPAASEAAVPLLSVTTPTPSAGSSGGLNAEVIFGMVNQHRVNAGIAPFEKHPEVCSIAESRRFEIENEIYGSSYIHAGFQARHIPYWATENMISQQTEAEAVGWWMNSSVHRSAILGGHRYACVVCQNKTCAMIFSSLEPK